VLLVDLRDDQIEGTSRRGLVLHHRDLEHVSGGEQPPRLSAELLEKIDAMLGQASGSQPPGGSASPARYRERLVTGYPDPLGRTSRRYEGAIEPVVITTREGQTLETEWIVLVQQPVK